LQQEKARDNQIANHLLLLAVTVMTSAFLASNKQAAQRKREPKMIVRWNVQQTCAPIAFSYPPAV
jgi:hypothetical protein